MVRRLLLVAAAALVDPENRVLVCQRPAGKSMAGLWEFPGGKVESGETPEQALRRELREELSIDACEECLAPFHFASHAYEDFHLLMPLFLCSNWEGEIVPKEGQVTRWVRASRLRDLDMPPADLPLIPYLRDLLG
jgi:8-oxo-dGTP diphosphatase